MKWKFLLIIEKKKTTDPRDRHAVVKLDRYQLEDRYLRMRDEIFELKKLSNAQEDKIKRLATKLMRASATPGSCLETALDFHVDKNRLDNLELENAKVREKKNLNTWKNEKFLKHLLFFSWKIKFPYSEAKF